MRLIVVLAEAILNTMRAHFQLTRAIADQMALTGEGETLLNNSINAFASLAGEIDTLKRDANNEPEVVQPVEQPPAA
jgi:hypothetical protein